MNATKKPVYAVVGVGPGNGAALARRFAAEGYAVALLARRPELTAKLAAKLSGSRPYACDAADPASVAAAFAAIGTRQRMPDKPDAFFIRPDAVAETALALTRQPPSAWSFEGEGRPFGEAW